MNRRGACYFCEADSRLREVSITPRARQDDPDGSVTVTLCRSCERKLERVLGGLFEHVESRGSADDPGTGASEPSPPDGHTGRVDRIDVGSNRRDDTPPRQGRRRLFSDPDEGDEATASEPATDGRAGSTDGTSEDAEIVDDGPRVHARATATSEEPLDGVSVAEYNRVMRLLQNREFPMARAAFVDLAANAYDLGEETAEAVLDAVIAKGALADRDGDLVRPDEGSP